MFVNEIILFQTLGENESARIALKHKKKTMVFLYVYYAFIMASQLLHLYWFNVAIKLIIHHWHFTMTNLDLPLSSLFSLCVCVCVCVCVLADRSVWPRRRVRRCSSAAVKETIAMRSSHTCQKPSLLQVNQPPYVTSLPCGPFFRIFAKRNL